MRHQVRRARWLAAVAALALLAVACGGQKSQGTPKKTIGRATMTPTGAFLAYYPSTSLKQAVDQIGVAATSQALAAGFTQAGRLEGDIKAPAAQLYAKLSALLQEHVYLFGVTLDFGVNYGLDGQAFKGSAATLDSNSTDLAELIGQINPHDQEAFLGLWRSHIRDYVDYTRGDKEEAVAALARFRQQAAAFFERLTGGQVPAATASSHLQGHIETMIAMIDVARATGQDRKNALFQKLKEASDQLDAGTWSKSLAAGIARHVELEGDVGAPAVEFYVRLANLFEEHVYLTFVYLKTALAAGFQSAPKKAASAVLEANTVALADLFGSVAGPRARAEFLRLWPAHIDSFLRYTAAAAARDEGGKQQAIGTLIRFRQQAGAFFENATGGVLHAGGVMQEFEAHIEAMTEMIDDLAPVLVRL